MRRPQLFDALGDVRATRARWRDAEAAMTRRWAAVRCVHADVPRDEAVDLVCRWANATPDEAREALDHALAWIRPPAATPR